MKNLGVIRKYSFHAGIALMSLAIIGTFLENGSSLQMAFFLISAISLCLVAYLNSQKMFTVLQGVVSIGAFIPFLELSNIIKSVIMALSGLLAIAYLVKINYLKEDKWWPIGGVGIIGLAVGFAVNGAGHLLLFNLLLAFAGITIAAYSAIGFFHLKNRISLIWLILNGVFFINPLILTLKFF